MKTIATILLTILFFSSVKGQTLPDRIKIVYNTYEHYAFSDTLYQSDTIVLTNKRNISKLFTELERYDTEEELLGKFKIDTAYINNNLEDILKLYDGKTKFDWNEKQKEFIFKKLKDINICREELDNYISNYKHKKKYHRFSISRLLGFRRVSICGFGMPTYSSEYVISVFSGNNITNIFKSRESTSSYNFPYKDQQNRVIYNYKIDKQLNDIFKREIKIDKPLKGDDLLKYIVNHIVDKNIRELYKLSAYSFEKEILELSSDFDIISFEEVYGIGRYIWDEPKTMKITLKNKNMLPNVYLQFLDSEYGNTLYSRDSIKKDYKDIVNRIQSINFITNYLKQDSSSQLDIYYFNNSGINEYNIDEVNKNPNEWKEHDERIEIMKKYSSYTDESIKISERIYCGCNYRFERDFIKKAIFFEITSNITPSSIWFLLPDETLLLYYVDSYNLKDAILINKQISQLIIDIKQSHACLRFDRNGKLIAK